MQTAITFMKDLIAYMNSNKIDFDMEEIYFSYEKGEAVVCGWIYFNDRTWYYHFSLDKPTIAELRRLGGGLKEDDINLTFHPQDLVANLKKAFE